MPSKPLKPCNQPGCHELTRERYCQQHKKEEQKRNDERRGTAAQRGYDSKWIRARKFYLRRHPLCVRCGRTANVVDHIIPHKGDMKLFWDSVDNWQSLCSSCHSRKTATEDGGFSNPVRRGRGGSNL